MMVLASADNMTPRFSPPTYTSDVGADEMTDGDIVEISVDPVGEDLHGKRVSVTSFDPRKYNCTETWPTIFRVNEVKNPRRAVP